MANWFDNKSQPPMGLAQRMMLEHELKMRTATNSPLAASRRVYSPLAASRRAYSPLTHLQLHTGAAGNQSPQLSPTLVGKSLTSKTMALLQTHAQNSRLHNLASAAANTSIALEMARKQKIRYQQQELLKQEQLQMQEQNSNFITAPSDIDVLLGRGGRSNHHVGNERFRDLIRSNRPRYNELPKHEKIKLSRAIVAAVQDVGGRFLEPAKDGKYYVVAPNKRAVEKTSQCLREKRADGHHHTNHNSTKSLSAAAIKAMKMAAAAEPVTSQAGTTSKAA